DATAYRVPAGSAGPQIPAGIVATVSLVSIAGRVAPRVPSRLSNADHRIVYRAPSMMPRRTAALSNVSSAPGTVRMANESTGVVAVIPQRAVLSRRWMV